MLNPRSVAIITTATLLFALDAFGAGKLSRAEVAGSIVGAKGNVLVDRQPVLAKETVFAGDVISTGLASGAYLNLHGTSAILVENSELRLSGTGSSMTLVKGAVVVRTSSPQAARVDVPGAYVLVRGDGTFPSVCRVAAVNASAVVIADKGQAEIHGSGAPTIVGSGKTVRLEHGVPQATGQTAGKVTGEIPRGEVQSAGQVAHRPLNLNDEVHWEDVVYTPDRGRLLIQLSDGSTLRVGAGSQMTIRRHDATTHQTELEIQAGKVRAEISKAGGTKFQCRNLPQPVAACATTPTAVIGVVGTTLQADVSLNETDVLSIEDDVTVGNFDPNVTGTVTLHAGQFTKVFHGLPPTGAIGLSPNQIAHQTNGTNVQEGLAATGGGVGGVTGASHLATVGAAGVGTGFAGSAISHLSNANTQLGNSSTSSGDASNSTGQAASSSSDAASAANAAANAATQTTNVETETTNNMQNQQSQGCGCPSPNSPQ